jgi:hypothetical protein
LRVQIAVILVFIAVCGLASAVLAGSAVAQEPKCKPGEPCLCIRAPEAVNYPRITISYDKFDKNDRPLGGGSIAMQAIYASGKLESACVPTDGAAYVKLVAACLGYNVISADLDVKAQPSPQQFDLRFRPLSMLPISLNVVDTKGNPAAGQVVRLEYPLTEASLFLRPRGAAKSGGRNGFVWTMATPPATTGSDGSVTISVPDLLRDPFIANAEGIFSPPAFRVTTYRADSQEGPDPKPATIPLQKSYPKTLTITIVQRAKLSGIVGDEFLARQGLEIPPEPAGATDAQPAYRLGLRLVTATRTSYGFGLRPDGSFSVSVPPGTYDLELYQQPAELGSENNKRFRVEKGPVLKEGERRDIVVEDGQILSAKPNP